MRLTPEALSQLADKSALIVDVRAPHEVDIVSLASRFVNYVNCPLKELQVRLLNFWLNGDQSFSVPFIYYLLKIYLNKIKIFFFNFRKRQKTSWKTYCRVTHK